MLQTYKIWENDLSDSEIIEMETECYGDDCSEQAMRLYCNLHGLEYQLSKDSLHCISQPEEVGPNLFRIQRNVFS